MGNWENSAELLEVGADIFEPPVLEFLARQDFIGLLQYTQDFGYEESKEGYVSKCHLCVDVRRHLWAKIEFEELRIGELYGHLDKRRLYTPLLFYREAAGEIQGRRGGVDEKRHSTPLLFYREIAGQTQGKHRRDVGRCRENTGERTKGGSIPLYSCREKPQGKYRGDAGRCRGIKIGIPVRTYHNPHFPFKYFFS